MKKFLAVLSSIALIGMLLVKPHRKSVSDYAKSIIHLHMVFTNPEGRQFGASCSGVYISPDGLALTAKHCTEEGNFKATTMLNVEENGDETYVQILAKDPGTDVALIKVWNVENVPYVKLAKKAFVGEVVYAIGHPQDMPLLITKGILCSLDIDGYFVSDALINPGSSGGALIDTDGNLVGLTVAESVDYQLFGLVMTKTGYAFIVPYSDIKRFLDTFKGL